MASSIFIVKVTHNSKTKREKAETFSLFQSLLANADMSIKEIAATLHFEDTSYMCRYFRQHTGLSPMEYRSGTKRA